MDDATKRERKKPPFPLLWVRKNIRLPRSLEAQPQLEVRWEGKSDGKALLSATKTENRLPIFSHNRVGWYFYWGELVFKRSEGDETFKNP